MQAQFSTINLESICFISLLLGITLFTFHFLKGMLHASRKCFVSKVKEKANTTLYVWKSFFHDVLFFFPIERKLVCTFIALGVLKYLGEFDLKFTSIVQDTCIFLGVFAFVWLIYELIIIFLVNYQNAGPINLDGFKGEKIIITKACKYGRFAKGEIQTKIGLMTVFVMDFNGEPLSVGDEKQILGEYCYAKVFTVVVVDKGIKLIDFNNPEHLSNRHPKYSYLY